ncbi:hypothetical protein [Paenibacillus sp. NEAU-GSW1]|uniref:hypothetical protein n=1 Tax=Paenibacillus sp. NEAU-GSW1 TaxID=2682486 RepID=UPI0012E14E4A|nr:hypothetical protein [Paenibacillus sp. NEAU-GSW1]MUT66023.1 hypothetical protein [Paenibacillus sp. NEAU-GSW1]
MSEEQIQKAIDHGLEPDSIKVEDVPLGTGEEAAGKSVKQVSGKMKVGNQLIDVSWEVKSEE